MSPQLRNNDWNVSDLLENVSCLLKVFDCVKELHQDTERKRQRRDVWEASWLSQGSVSLSTQHVLITSVSDRTTTSKPPTLVPLSLSQLGNWWAPCGCVWRPRARKRHMCVCSRRCPLGWTKHKLSRRICCHMQTGEKSAHTTLNRPPQIAFWCPCVCIWGKMCVSHREELLKFKWLWHSVPCAPLLQVLKSWRDKTLQATRGSRLCAVTLYN